MKAVHNIAAQGDVLFVRTDTIPQDAKPRAEAAEHVVAHSETGHHHVVRGKGVEVYDDATDPLTSYVRFKGRLPVEHQRSYHTHEALELVAQADATIAAIDDAVGTFKIVRQRQQTPEGMQRVVD